MSEIPVNQIVCGDCLKVLSKLPKAKMIFADPPDNLGLKYKGFVDKWRSNSNYIDWLFDVVVEGVLKSEIFWLSYNAKWTLPLIDWMCCSAPEYGWSHTLGDTNFLNRNFRQFIWRFTFGQHNHKDCGNGYRPILRIIKPDAKLYPDAIREPSKRQTSYNDKRANPAGRVPDDVWQFSRICGTFKEKRHWHPNQHPEALIERIVKLSCKKGDLVIDMFAGTGTANRVCKRLGINCIGIEISRYYCDQILEEGFATERAV